MEIIAKAKSVRISPRKVSLIADSIRKLPLEEALKVLVTLKKRGGIDLMKTLKGAISNAVKNNFPESYIQYLRSIMTKNQ